MSELVYVDYLKELNNTLLTHSCNLNLDFEIGSSHVMDQLAVLEQYLSLNNLSLQGEKNTGINNLLGFVELSEDLWYKRFVADKQKELKEIQKRNQLFKKGIPHEIVVVSFEEDLINDLEEDLPDIEVDLFEDDIDDNEIPETVSEETSEIEDNENDTDTEDEIPVLTDVFDELQKAQLLFDEEDDLDDYQDEYAIIEEEDETDEHYPEDNYEANTEGFDFDTSEQSDIGEPGFGFDDNTDGDDSGFTFEQPQQAEQRERVLTDAIVDKANETINKGINALLKKIAKD